MLPNFVRNVGLCEDGTNYILYRKIIITKTNMNTDKIFARGGQPYEAPSVTPLDILSEGLLCQSGEFTLEDWKLGENNWFENE